MRNIRNVIAQNANGRIALIEKLIERVPVNDGGLGLSPNLKGDEQNEKIFIM